MTTKLPSNVRLRPKPKSRHLQPWPFLLQIFVLKTDELSTSMIPLSRSYLYFYMAKHIWRLLHELIVNHFWEKTVTSRLITNLHFLLGDRHQMLVCHLKSYLTDMPSTRKYILFHYILHNKLLLRMNSAYFYQ